MSRIRHAAVRTFAVTYSSGQRLPPHAHDWHQLIYASQGAMRVETPEGSWVVPPLRAVWVPAGVPHSVEMAGAVAMRTLYVHPRVSRVLPRRCTVVGVSQLLRALVLHAVDRGALEPRRREDQHLVAVLIDQIRSVPTSPLRLTQPHEPRARRMAELITQTLGAPQPLAALARRAGAGKRTLERTFRAETGLSLGRWRAQLRLLRSLESLARGVSVTETALEVGYESTSAFIFAFRRVLGTTPHRYFRAS
jgi:AraC-like DNA-binding protein